MPDELPETDPGVELVEKCLRDLSEFWDSVHICSTRKDNDSGGGFTDLVSRGNGNKWARYGSLKDTVVKMEEEMRINIRKANE